MYRLLLKLFWDFQVYRLLLKLFLGQSFQAAMEGIV